jgi:Putative heavy-metal-binding
MKTNIQVTTGDLKQNYTIILPIFVQISNKGILKNEFEKLEIKYQILLKDLQEKGVLTPEHKGKKDSLRELTGENKSDIVGLRMEKAFYIAIEELKKKAEKLDADAVVSMRYETDLVSGNHADFYLQMYGTAVKFV